METTETGESNTYFNQIKNEQIIRLVNVGFTKKQAEVLLEIIKEKAIS